VFLIVLGDEDESRCLGEESIWVPEKAEYFSGDSLEDLEDSWDKLDLLMDEVDCLPDE